MLLLLLVLPASAHGQEGTISIFCPPMPVRKVGRNLMLWQCDREVCVATLIFPDGKRVVIDHEVIEPTLVRGVNARVSYVDACDSTGTAKDGTYLFLRLPKEKVILTGLGTRTALAIKATGYVVTADGAEYSAEAVYPDCRTHWIRPGLRIAEAITAQGKFWRIK